jgi:hypothetical protein
VVAQSENVLTQFRDEVAQSGDEVVFVVQYYLQQISKAKKGHVFSLKGTLTRKMWWLSQRMC